MYAEFSGVFYLPLGRQNSRHVRTLMALFGPCTVFQGDFLPKVQPVYRITGGRVLIARKRRRSIVRYRNRGNESTKIGASSLYKRPWGAGVLRYTIDNTADQCSERIKLNHALSTTKFLELFLLRLYR